MTIPIFKRPQALRDIEECFVYIGVDNLEAALAFIQALDDCLQLLSENPYLGVAKDFSDPKLKGMRMWVIRGFDHYEVFYIADDDRVDVIRVLHSARDYTRFFGGD